LFADDGGRAGAQRSEARHDAGGSAAMFPGSKDDEEVKAHRARPLSQFGVSELIIRPAKFESKDKFTGINNITFSLLDGRVSSVNVGYNGPAYPHVDQFVTKFVAGRVCRRRSVASVPGMDTQMKTLTCKDFEIRVFTGGEAEIKTMFCSAIWRRIRS